MKTGEAHSATQHVPDRLLSNAAITHHAQAQHGRPRKTSRLIDASPVYYGWLVVLASTIGMAFTIPGQTVGISLFIDGIMVDLGLSRTVVSAAYTGATVLGAMSLPFIGRWIDRVGPRRAVVGVAIMFALGCVWMGFVGGLIALFVGFVMLRAMGQGALSLVSLHAVNIWFVRGRGTAVGVMGVGLAMAIAIFPPIIERGLDVLSWRSMFFIIALVLVAVLLPIGITLFREKPEHYGVRPDGVGDSPHDVVERSFTLAEARRTRAFLLLTAGGVCVATLGTGLMFHHFSMMEMNGLGRGAAAALFIPLGFLTAASNLTSGYLMDRVPPRILLAVMLILLAGMLMAVPFVRTLGAVWAYGSLFGIIQGLYGALTGSGYAYYFGRDHIGAIKGFSATIFVGGSAAGPLIYAAGLDVLGSYTLVLVLTGVITGAIGLMAGVTRDEGLLPDPVE